MRRAVTSKNPTTCTFPSDVISHDSYTTGRTAQIFSDCAITKYLSLHSRHIDPPVRLGNYCQLVSLCLLRLRCMRLPLSMSPTALTALTATESCAEYRLRLRGNYRDKDMPRYNLNITIFDTIRYIVPSLVITKLYKSTNQIEASYQT